MSRRPDARPAGRIAAAGSVVGVAVLVAGCGGGSSPSAGGASQAGVKVIAVKLTNDGCALPSGKLTAGAMTFNVTNEGGTAVSEFEIKQGDKILGEKENLVPGLSGTFSLALAPGDYTAYCPGAATPTSPFTVIAASGGTSVTSADLTAATSGYATYVKDQAAELTRSTTAFVAALKAGDVARAKALYGPSRVFYERIEPVAESFGDLDPQIDAREGDVPAAEFGGFHKIEQILWTKNTTAGTAPYADKLLADVKKLQALVATATYQPAQLANGATELLGEVSRSKITGEEERYSHIDLVDFKANVDGSKEAFNLLLPALTKVDPTLATTVTNRFAAVEAGLAKYRSGDGFVLYSELEPADIRTLAQQVDALAEPLSLVAGKVVSG